MEYESKKRARADYRQKHDIVRIVLDLPRLLRDDLRERALSSGKSLTAYILDCVSAATGVPLGSSADATGVPPGSSADATGVPPGSSADATGFLS